MKIKSLIVALIVLIPFSTMGQLSTDQNFKYTSVFGNPVDLVNVLGAGSSDKKESVTYFNGKGRIIQSILLEFGGNMERVISPNSFNEFYISNKQYLPYSDNVNSLSFQSSALSDQLIFYNSSKYSFTTNPYTESVHTDDPLLNVIEQSFPGSEWGLSSGHTIKNAFQIDLLSHPVYLFDVSFGSGDISSPNLIYTSELLNSDEVIINQVKNENWMPVDGNNNTSLIFIDEQGRNFLTRRYEANIPHDTYYVYDLFGNLAFVIPPKAADSIVVSGALALDYLQTLDSLGYQFIYDSLGRLSERKNPGKSWEYFIYDNLDRIILSQDGNMRLNNQWNYIKFDTKGNPAYTGIFQSTLTKSAIESEVLLATSNYEIQENSITTIGGSDLYYTNQAYPTTDISVLTVSYYDTYIDVPTSHIDIPTDPIYGVTPATNISGLSTVKKSRILGTDDWITTVYGYDDFGSIIETSSYNEYLDIVEELWLDLDFTSKVLNSRLYHKKGSDAPIITLDYFSYDNQGRLKTHLQDINSEGLQLIADNTYDELGKLVKKKVGGKLFASGYTDLNRITVSADGLIQKDDPDFPIHGPKWNSGLATIGKIVDDGGISFTTVNEGRSFMVGLNDVSNNNGFGEIDYGFKFQEIASNPEYIIRFEGSNVTSSTGYQEGDTFALEREGTTMYFKKNGAVVHSQAITGSNPPLLGDVSFRSEDAAIRNLQFYATNIDKVLQEVDYTYNIRGWLNELNPIADLSNEKNTDLFSYKLNYTQIEGGADGAVPLYNGNIAQTIWQSANDDIKRGYAYSYDDLNRISKAAFKQGDNLMYDAGEHRNDLKSVSYDKMGNIIALERRGRNTANSSNPMWDILTYQISGNQLLNVTDDSSVGTTSQYGFIDGNVHSTTGLDDYSYDVNGNMISDANKGVTSITYNHLNLPEVVTIYNNSDPGDIKDGTITYIYDATGVKQSKVYYDNTTANSSTTIYGNGVVYVNNSLEFISQPEGYIYTTLKDGVTRYEYAFQYKDHLGNVRLTYGDINGDGSVNSSEIIEESNYYPFGLTHKGYNDVTSGGNNTAQNWKFNGVEQNNDLNFGIYDTPLRQYDPTIGRWNLQDPVTHFDYSPYSAFDNNPIVWSDPSGADSYDYDDPPSEDGSYDTEQAFGDDGLLYSWNLNNSAWELVPMEQLAEICIGCNIKAEYDSEDIVVEDFGMSDESHLTTQDVAMYALGANLGGNTVASKLYSDASKITKADFVIGRLDPKFITDFNNALPKSGAAMGNLYEPGYKESLKQISIVRTSAGLISTVGNVAGYSTAAFEFIEGNYASAAVEGASARTSVYIGAKYGWVAGLGWSAGWESGRALSKTEPYNRTLFGIYSKAYLSRAFENQWDIRLNDVQIHLARRWGIIR